MAPFVASKLVGSDGNALVPFLLGAAAVLVAAIVLSTVHRALGDADRGAVAQPELDDLDRVEREEELQVAAGVGNET